jgi:C4-dicarboxylate transporter, DctM subunit
MESVLTLIILGLLFSLGVPVAFALAGAGLAGIWLITGNLTSVMAVFGTTPFSSVANYTLTTIPMFILMAFFSASGGLAQDLFDTASSWLSQIRGGLGIATVFACGVFGAMSGTSLAAASVMAAIAMPNMRRFGYSETLAAGVIGVGATLDTLIPPSLSMVLYGILTGQSIGKLLIAGIIPGIVFAIILVSIILIWVTVSPNSAPMTQKGSWEARWRSLIRTWPGISMILLITAALYTGVATPTEVGAIGAFLAAVIGVAMGRLTWASAVDAIKKTISISGMIFMLIIGGYIFGYFVTLSQMPQHVMSAVNEMNIHRWVLMTGVCFSYFILSMFMDEIVLMIITIQVAYPLIISLGFDPIWFGVVMILLICIGLVFPPVGTIAFIVSAVTKVDLVKVYKGTSILTIALFITIFLIMLFPQIVLWLPSTMK